MQNVLLSCMAAKVLTSRETYRPYEKTPSGFTTHLPAPPTRVSDSNSRGARGPTVLLKKYPFNCLGSSARTLFLVCILSSFCSTLDEKHWLARNKLQHPSSLQATKTRQKVGNSAISHLRTHKWGNQVISLGSPVTSPPHASR